MTKPWAGRIVTKARKDVRARGRYQECWRCGSIIDLDVDRWHVGHVIDRVNGGGHDDGNLEPEHGRCSESAGGKLAQSRARARRRVVVEREQRLRRW